MIMKLKEGDAVEVLRSEFCWFPAKIVSTDKHDFLVRFDCDKHNVERVRLEDLRPSPPDSGKNKRWILGDIVEAFDCHSWRAGKIVKVFHDNKYVVKVFSSILLKEFHGSCLRVQLTWHNDQWKDSGNKRISSEAVHGNQAIQKLGGQFVNEEEKNLGNLASSGHVKRNNFSVHLSGFDAVEARSKKRKTDFGRKELWLSEREPAKQENEEVNECSIASCGSNHVLESTIQDPYLSSRMCGDRSFNDAWSPCPVKSRKTVSSYEEEEFADNIHKLELQAYRSTVQAFYASGPLSWDQESLLTNLRMLLNISNEEHLLQLRQLLSAPVG